MTRIHITIATALAAAVLVLGSIAVIDRARDRNQPQTQKGVESPALILPDDVRQRLVGDTGNILSGSIDPVIDDPTTATDRLTVGNQ